MFQLFQFYTHTLQLNGFSKHARKMDKNWLFNNLSIYKINYYTMENALYEFCSPVELYQKTQLVNKNRTRAFSMV